MTYLIVGLGNIGYEYVGTRHNMGFSVLVPFGMMRMRKGGSAGGHNGLANIAEMLGTQDYPRLRIGIGSHVGRGPQVEFVLGKWDEEEEKQLPEIRERAVEAVKSFGLAGIERTMTQFNRQ